MHTELNQIFYGPPGTGKTYNVAISAENIVNIKKTKNSSSLTDSENFFRILQLVREKYQSNEFKAKSNSLYRNDRAIMWISGYLIESNENAEKVLSKSVAIDRGMKTGPSYWSQVSQYITQFGQVDNWRDSSNIELNSNGEKLRDLLKSKYTISQLKSWGTDCPQEVRDFYSDILINIKIENFTPVIKMIYGALCMAKAGELYRQNNEDRNATEDEKENATKYFDLKADFKDLKWIGHLARILQGLGIVEQEQEEIHQKNILN